MLVEMDLPNTDGRIRPGLYGQARLALEKREGVIALPATAVRTDGGEAFVYVVGGNDTLRRVNVTLGVAQQGWVEIGAASGTRRVVTGPTAHWPMAQPCVWLHPERRGPTVTTHPCPRADAPRDRVRCASSRRLGWGETATAGAAEPLPSISHRLRLPLSATSTSRSSWSASSKVPSSRKRRWPYRPSA
jgi:hypothetical protein